MILHPVVKEAIAKGDIAAFKTPAFKKIINIARIACQLGFEPNYMPQPYLRSMADEARRLGQHQFLASFIEQCFGGADEWDLYEGVLYVVPLAWVEEHTDKFSAEFILALKSYGAYSGELEGQQADGVTGKLQFDLDALKTELDRLASESTEEATDLFCEALSTSMRMGHQPAARVIVAKIFQHDIGVYEDAVHNISCVADMGTDPDIFVCAHQLDKKRASVSKLCMSEAPFFLQAYVKSSEQLDSIISCWQALCLSGRVEALALLMILTNICHLSASDLEEYCLTKEDLERCEQIVEEAEQRALAREEAEYQEAMRSREAKQYTPSGGIDKKPSVQHVTGRDASIRSISPTL